MAATWSKDYNGVQAKMSNGVWQELSVPFLVTGLTSSSMDDRYAEAIAAVNLPVGTYAAYPYLGLQVIDHDVTQREGVDHACVVTVTYRRVGSPEADNFIFSTSTNVQQTETVKDIYGNPIYVQYTYPSNYPNSQLAGRSDTEVGQVKVAIPQRVCVCSGLWPVERPYWMTKLWLGKLNLTPWANEDAGCWLCTRCDSEPVDVTQSPPLHRFHFEFTCNPFGWEDYAYYKTRDTDLVPSDVVAGVGIKRPTVYQRIEFRAFPPYFID